MEYIISQQPQIIQVSKQEFDELNKKINQGVLLTKEEKERYLDYIVNESRKILSDYLNVNIIEDSLTNRCDLAQKVTGKLIDNPHIYVYPKETQNIFYPTCKGHSFLVCIIQNVPYLIDLTYRQFFLKKNCNKEKYFVKDDKVLLTPDPGFFLMDDNDSIKIASQIIQKGYIELTTNVAKKYGDSFYFTKSGNREYSDINGKIYYNAMIKENHQYAVDDERFLEMYGKVM